MHSDCEGCPYHDACLEKACIKETRHEIDAVVTVDVTAHNLFSVPECPLHGGSRTGHFPADIKAAVQYGKNLQASVMRIIVLCACFSLYTVQYVLSMYIIICVPIIYYYLYILHYIHYSLISSSKSVMTLSGMASSYSFFVHPSPFIQMAWQPAASAGSMSL